MAPHGDNREYVQKWLTECVPHSLVCLINARNLKNGREREVWDCTFQMKGTEAAGILAIFKPGPLTSVNTNLPPDQAARKCALAMTELPALGIPTPRVLGYAASDGEAAVVCERIERTEWEPRVRIQAAGILARIHNLEESSLSVPFRELARNSDPREQRTTGGDGPVVTTRTLVHGDYFSANILPTAGGLCVIDWETFGWGDPMWDLGFLIGADHGLPDDEVDDVIAEYELVASVDRPRLMWHKRRWSDYWQQRESQVSNRPDAGDT